MPLLKHNDLWITIKASKQIVNFLDITSNLNKGSCHPNTTLQYIHCERNHSPTTTKNIPASINKQLSTHSCNKTSFDQAAPQNQKALDKSEYQETPHDKPNTPAKRKNRQWKNKQPSIQQKCWHQHWAQIPCPTKQTIP